MAKQVRNSPLARDQKEIANPSSEVLAGGEECGSEQRGDAGVPEISSRRPSAAFGAAHPRRPGLAGGG